jgi:WD40 repeat protein
MDLSADGRQVVTVCTDSQRQGQGQQDGFRLAHWDLAPAARKPAKAEPSRTFFIADATVTSIAFEPDAHGVLVASKAREKEASFVHRWDLTDGQYRPLWSDRLNRGSIWSAIPSADGTRVLTMGGSGARLWDTKNGQLQQTFSPHGPLTAVGFSPSGALAVTAGSDGAVKVWSVAEQAADYGQVRIKLPQPHSNQDGNACAVQAVAFAPARSGGDRLLLTAGADGTVKLWDLRGQTPKEVKKFPHAAPVHSAVFSPDGTQVATAAHDGTARIWDVTTGEGAILGGEKSHELAVLCVCFSADGQRVLTGGDDNTIKIWDVAGKAELQVLKGHTASITSVAFSPDGRRIVSGSQDGLAKVWDAASGNQVLSLSRHTAEVTAVAVAPDGRRILTASSDQTAVVWPSVNISPTITLSEEPLTYSEFGQTVVIDDQLALQDPDSPDFGGGRLTVRLVAEEGVPAADERIALRDEGAGPGQVSRDGDQLAYDYGNGAGPVPLGVSRVGQGQAAHGLTVDLVDGAKLEAVQALLRSLTYTADSPLKSPRKIRFEISDPAGGRSHPAEKAIVAAVPEADVQGPSAKAPANPET